MRRGQMEIMGLIMITVLAGFVIVFALSYASQNAGQQTEQRHESFGEEALAGRFVNVMAQTDVAGCNLRYSQVVKACLNNRNLQCGGAPACDVMNDVASEILEDTLNEWNTGYIYDIRDEDGNSVSRFDTITAQGCTEEAPKESPGRYRVVLNSRGDVANIVLEICSS